MAQDVTIAGASFEDVPGILVPKTSSGTAYFADTSDADATAGDIASGKTAYVNGVKLTGTGSGGGGYFTVTDTTDAAGGTVRTITPTSGTAVIQTGKSVTITSNTTTNVTPDTGYTALSALQIITNVSGGGGGGLVYEEGTYTPAEDVLRGEIQFQNQHTDPPFFIMLIHTTTGYPENSTITAWSFEYYYALAGTGALPTTPYNYGFVRSVYASGGGYSSSISDITHTYAETGSSRYYPSYWATNTGFYPAQANTSSPTMYLRDDITYKWVAVWAPTT